MSSITLTQVTKVFVSKPVVDNVSLNVTSGEFLVLLGPSGCGKSTLLRMLAGLESLTSGEIHLGGRRVDALPPSARDMAFVFQSYALYPHMTVRRNMTFPLIMRQFKWWFHIPIIGHLAKRRIEASPDVSAMVDRTAHILALTDMLDRHPRTLSGGQRQRVALGRAMVRQPEVFLMDEPLSNLDAKLRSSMRAEIIKLHRKLGGTFVYVTHDQIEAMTMGTRIVMMREGVVQQVGTPRDIYANQRLP
jgi:multiple sugar transport system ATP-binding protein